ncbi:anaerobic ribonucleoside-triphosphate reductase activating protein [Thermodesulfovibrionales bacterium]|nr:anaerobic ribonucleoside-triphosphate reductase activating protein [Thermodesulfovibrionales bacterium]
MCNHDIEMLIGGFQKSSLIDYPGRICATIFTMGCNFRCLYCHNPELVMPQLYREPISEEEILGFLEKRKAVLEGITVTGGEPLLHKDLPLFLKDIKEMGYAIKLDTNGSFPERLRQVIDEGLVDYVAMDIKGPLSKYNLIAGVTMDTGDIKKSIDIIMNSNIYYTFRTTVIKSLLTIEDLRLIAQMIKGAGRYVLQRFVAGNKLVDDSCREREKYSLEEIQKFQEEIDNIVSG